jgi:cytochrome c oxidase subunit I
MSESTFPGQQVVIDAHGTVHDAHHEHHHHEESFISKYVFSQDHKMIAKQFLITGMIWAIIGGLF